MLVPNLKVRGAINPQGEGVDTIRRRITMTSRVLRNFLFLPVALAVCASFSVAQSGAITRVEQNDPSITYSGTWYSNDSPVVLAMCV